MRHVLDNGTLLASLQQTVAGNEATLRSTTAGLIAGSRVLDTGIPAAGTSKKKFALEYGGGAIFGGLVVAGLVLLLAFTLRRGRGGAAPAPSSATAARVKA